MDVSKNQALFSLLGMTYGGNGSTTFNLPDLRGRAIVGANPMQADYTLGHAGGAETVAITTAQMPPIPGANRGGKCGIATGDTKP